MLTLQTDSEANLVIVTPEGAISEADIAELTEGVNGYINAHDKAPNVLIDAGKFPGWQDLSAMGEHFKFARDHQRLIAKVAVVGEGILLNVLPSFLNIFAKAKLRHFPTAQRDLAITWLTAEEEQAGGYTLLDGFPNDVIAIEGEGKITADTYRALLAPLVAEKLKRHDKLKIFAKLGPDFEGFSAGAMWDDARLGLGHLTTFHKIAIVSDLEWVTHGAKFFGHIMPSELVVFSLENEDDAAEWIRT